MSKVSMAQLMIIIRIFCEKNTTKNPYAQAQTVTKVI